MALYVPVALAVWLIAFRWGRGSWRWRAMNTSDALDRNVSLIVANVAVVVVNVTLLLVAKLATH